VTSEDVRRASPGEVRADGGRTRPHDGAGRIGAPAAQRGVDGPHDERIPVRGLRKRIWENMATSSFTAAHFTFVEECNVTELVVTRDRFNEKLQPGEEKLSFLPFIVKAVLAALKKFPDLNAHVDDDTMEYVRRGDCHIGIAAATERGLMVPVIRHADRLSILDLSREIKRLGEAARTGKITAQDLGGSTFTITSLGKDGGIFATPIINYPEVAIMGVHKISKKPVVRDDKIVIGEMMNLSLSFDHRLIDGHVGAAFTYAVIRLLENPERLMMEMV
jgi:pyruvate dehydrogenase E2 component (dihydrolipoamide acetyltransferase)